MRIDKAIEVGTGVVEGGKLITDKELREFAQLSIEVLKEYKRLRALKFRPSSLLLPGETEE